MAVFDVAKERIPVSNPVAEIAHRVLIHLLQERSFGLKVRPDHRSSRFIAGFEHQTFGGPFIEVHCHGF